MTKIPLQLKGERSYQVYLYGEMCALSLDFIFYSKILICYIRYLHMEFFGSNKTFM